MRDSGVTGPFLRAIASAVRLLVRDPRSLWLATRIAAWIVFLSIAGRLFPLPAMLRAVETRRRWPSHRRVSPERIESLVDRVFFHDILFQRACWKRAAVLRRYLLMNGVETQIVFGVRKGSGGPLDGHAWLELGGRPYLEATSPDYIVTFRYPA